MVRRLTIWHSRREVSSDEAVRHWRGIHKPLVMAVPGVRRYVQSRCLAGPGETEPIHAGLGELWFDSMAIAVAAQHAPMADGR